LDYVALGDSFVAGVMSDKTMEMDMRIISLDN